VRYEHAADARYAPGGGDHASPAGAEKLWAGTVTIEPDAKTGAHHHGDLESVIYVVRSGKTTPAQGMPLHTALRALHQGERHARRPAGF